MLSQEKAFWVPQFNHGENHHGTQIAYLQDHTWGNIGHGNYHRHNLCSHGNSHR